MQADAYKRKFWMNQNEMDLHALLKHRPVFNSLHMQPTEHCHQQFLFFSFFEVVVELHTLATVVFVNLPQHAYSSATFWSTENRRLSILDIHEIHK